MKWAFCCLCVSIRQVVGRQGATAKAIRSLLRIVGVKHDARVNLKIEEPEGSTRGLKAPVEPGAEEVAG